MFATNSLCLIICPIHEWRLFFKILKADFLLWLFEILYHSAAALRCGRRNHHIMISKQQLNLCKAEIPLCMYVSNCSHLTGNAVRLHYKVLLSYGCQANNPHLFWETYETDKSFPREKSTFSLLKQVVPTSLL
jgi:hypothetical protein